MTRLTGDSFVARVEVEWVEANPASVRRTIWPVVLSQIAGALFISFLSALGAIAEFDAGRSRQSPSTSATGTHMLDAGTASGYLALQAHLSGWHVHGMAGFDRDSAMRVLNVPDDHMPLAVYAIGRLGDPTSLPEALRKREHQSSRLPLTELAFEGRF